MFRVLGFLLTILITNAFAKCWKLSAVLRNTYFLPRLRLFLKKIWSNKFFLPVLNKNYNSFNFNFCKTVRDRFPCVWKPAPRSSMGCKFYGRFFFSSRKILSVVCRLVDHSIGLFIIFRKISRPVYERENVTPVQNFRIKGHFCHRLKKKDTSVHKMTLLSHWSFVSSKITIWTLKGQLKRYGINRLVPSQKKKLNNYLIYFSSFFDNFSVVWREKPVCDGTNRFVESK